MVLPHAVGDYYHKYRPRRFEEVVGHTGIIASIKSAVNQPSPPRAFLLSGASGTGKTTTARIMALAFNCLDIQNQEPCLKCSNCQTIIKGSIDVFEMNAADTRGIDDIRALASGLSSMPLTIDKKIIILDECQQLLKDSQNILLKVLEEAPPHVVIILCTTDPAKLLPTIQNRCQHFNFKPLKTAEIRSLINEVVAMEGLPFESEVYNAIVEKAAGCPRQALVLLQQVSQAGIENKEQALQAIGMINGEDQNVFRLCEAIVYKDWAGVAKEYENVSSLPIEGSWMMIAGYFRNKLLKQTKHKDAYFYGFVLDMFSEPVFNYPKPENKLVANLFKASNMREELFGTQNKKQW